MHLAPERGIYERLSSLLKRENYVVADIDPSRYQFASNVRQIDLTDMGDWNSNEFDLVIHSHVLEHIPCNIAYSLFHLHRILKPNGRHLCVIPFSSGVYDECFDEIGNMERTKRFGQYDHLRKFGDRNLQMHLGSLLRIPETFDATQHFDEDALRLHNIPESHWRGFHMSTVLSLEKNDYRLFS